MPFNNRKAVKRVQKSLSLSGQFEAVTHTRMLSGRQQVTSDKNETTFRLMIGKLRMRGVEPPRGCPHKDLNLARLPVPPHPQRLQRLI